MSETSPEDPRADAPSVPRPSSWLPREELVRILDEAQADSGLRDDLRELAGDTTDDLGPIR